LAIPDANIMADTLVHIGSYTNWADKTGLALKQFVHPVHQDLSSLRFEQPQNHQRLNEQV
jgi:hypothetical protein